ncbi:MAG: BTAD domain-containing putative transcriptional regulator, partial [Acidimicrobiales bacterium]
MLVLSRGRMVTKDQLADWLWGDHLPKSVNAALATYVSVVRRRLPDPRLVQTQTGGYRFGIECTTLDLDTFDQLIGNASKSGPGAARALFEQAIGLVRGDLVEDERYADWAEPERARYREATVAALLGAADAALACRDGDAALAHAERALHYDSVCERASRSAMLSAYFLGRQEDALRAYRRCENELGVELGVEPMQQTRDLLAAIRNQSPVAELLPPPAWDRLPAAIDLRSTHSELLGRRSELDLLRKAVKDARSGSFVLALVDGGAGMGKTRLLDELLGGFQGIAVGRTKCSALERNLPFVSLASALRSALPASAPDPLTLILSSLSANPGDAGRLRALEQIAELARAHCPLVIVIEDLHHADEETITGVSYLSRRCTDAALAVIGTLRADELPPGHPAGFLESAPRITLERLTRDDLSAAG